VVADTETAKGTPHMKLSSLFNIIMDGQDVLDLFEGVTNVDQLRGRMRRLSQIEADDLLACLVGLRTSIAGALNDTLEISADLEDPESDLDDAALPDGELADLGGEDLPSEDQSPEPVTPPEK
jgi:hypothetical protein